METISNLMKIKAIMEYYGLNQSEMAAKMGIHQANLSEILREKRACGPGIMTKLQITFPEVNTKWLYQEGDNNEPMILPNHPTISGDITVNGNHNSHIGHGNTHINDSNINDDATYIEVEEVERAPIISATLARAPQVDVLEAVSEKADELEKAPVGVFNAPVSVWYRVQDESLAPKYEVGDLLALWAYPKGEEDPIPGKMYGINTSTNGLIVRRLFPQDDGGYIAKAANREEFPDYRIKPGNVVQIYKIMLMVRF